MYKSKWPVFSEEMITNVSNVLQSGKVNQWTGSKVFEFEKAFSEYFGVKHSVAVFNGSVAIELCLKAIGIEPGDEVIVTARSFIASASSVNIVGAIPVFVDVDINSQNMTLQNIKNAYTSRTKAIIAVHLAGWPCEIEEIIEWCHSKNLFVIEDCAQAHGAKYKNKYVGTWGDINAWSFCQDKIISTGGEGGMITTNNTELFKKAWSYKDHGKNYDKIFSNPENSQQGTFRWLHDTIGTNWRMTEMQASIGIDSLKKLNEWIEIRRKNAHIFNTVFSTNEGIRLTIPDDRFYHSYYKYYFFVNSSKLKKNITRDLILKEIISIGIPCFQGTCGEIYREKAYGMNISLDITKELTETSLMVLVDPSYTEHMIKKLQKKLTILFINI